MNVVVGVGYVGRRLLDSLPGETRLGLSRSPGRDDVRLLDLDDAARPDVELSPDAAIVYTIPPSREHDDDVRLARFLDALTAPPRRFVYLSTTGVYGDRGGQRVDETAPVNPQSERAKRRVDAEQKLDAWCARQATTLLVLRVPGIYGPGRLGTDRIDRGEPVLDETDANPGNRIHVDDLVACCVAALTGDAPAGIYNLGDGDERSSTWFSREVARQLGIEPPPTVSRARAEREFSARRLSFLGESRRVDISKMKSVLGVTPRYADAADGIRASIDAERGNCDRA